MKGGKLQRDIQGLCEALSSPETLSWLEVSVWQVQGGGYRKGARRLRHVLGGLSDSER